MKKGPYYPVFLDLEGRACLVVGGGRVAERKVLSLLRAGARVKVISPGLTSRLRKEASRGRITYIPRRYRKTDLRGAFLVVAATDSPEENRRVSSAAGPEALVNVVDQPEHCTFIVPSAVSRGPLVIAISTSGTSPAMARTVRKELEALYGKQFGAYLRRLGRLRARAVRDIPDPKERQRYLKALGSDEAVRALRKGRTPKTRNFPPD